MATVSQPQSQAGVMSFYDAPARGPQMNAKFVLVAIVVFAIVILVLDHLAK
ncbi:MAG: preprotein translocase subunit Sec61beta [Candidatus Micrarchaeota archaeon]|nr:preprotein translocase subunit Sec61beta [Candidatus Micrarchaeota archaeon]MDE1804399.1 preprotein translocase subunit Sec61beta [Candidatus Micrarchaeota archaeon]MDE1846753.1 preprotein translocase subunit Sec61beta [Candidatus Micrarchaeota archaeon]